MPFWMTHPEHGRMPVYDRGEVERVGKFGWVLLNEGEEPIAAPPKPGAAPAPTSKEEAIALLDARGVKYDKRWSLKKLLELVEA